MATWNSSDYDCYSDAHDPTEWPVYSCTRQEGMGRVCVENAAPPNYKSGKVIGAITCIGLASALAYSLYKAINK